MAQTESFDVVVIGSGFGGSVMAYRLASEGYSVCVLERGRAYPPGSFARTPKQMGKNFWHPEKGQFGLFQIWSFRNAEVVGASGLGGGSLIYANVLLRKPEKWFVREHLQGQGFEYWPVTREDLDPHYEAVERVLRPTPYPFDRAPYSETPKTKAFLLAAKALGRDGELAPLAITFANRGSEPVPGERIDEPPNIHGERGARHTCRLTGECDLGCNWGSKNTLDFNYLTMAAGAGAAVMTRCDVKKLWPLGERGERGYAIEYADRAGEDEDPSRPGHWQPRVQGRERRVTIEAKSVVIAAGSLGSTFLLLKMRDRGALPRLSPMLGRRFSGGGDFLGFAARCREWQGERLVPATIDATYGPVITSYMRFPDRLDDPDNRAIDNRGFYLEDGGFPNIAAWAVEVASTPGVLRRAAAVAWQMALQRVTGKPGSTIGAEAARFLGDAEYSGGTLPILGMGRELPTGVMRRSKRGWLELDWDREDSDDYFTDLREASARVATALAARDFKVSLSWYLRRLLTSHPSGGCVMGRARENGVVDEWGAVFGYDNLYVADGSVLPGPVGTNPSLTIAALADRFAYKAIENLAASAAAAPPRAERDEAPRSGRFARTRLPEGATAPAGADELDDGPPVEVSFTEELHGFFSLGDSEDYEEGFRRGRRDGNAIAFNVTIEIEDVVRFIQNPEHEARAEGWVQTRDFGGMRPITSGSFNLFAPGHDPMTKLVRYDLAFEDTNGNPFVLRGHKEVRDDRGPDLWVDMTTLFTRIVARHPATGEDANTIAYGILQIDARAFMEELKTFASSAGASGLARFGRFFFHELADTYGLRLRTGGGG